jgi:hypothetical protein
MLAPAGLAQNMATISGTVVDQSGGAIAGAAVQILDDAKQTLVREATTDGSGRFDALYIQPGTYTIKVARAGFKTLSRKGVILDVNTKVYDDAFRLEVGGVTDNVSVTAEIPPVQTSTAEKSFLVDQRQVSDLPMNGRNFNALVSTLPGVSSTAQSNFNIVNGTYVDDLHIAGSRGSQNQVYLDGAPNLTGGDSSAVYAAVSIDALSEFKIQMNNFSAEYGRNAGAVIAVQTRSGSSAFHGSLYEYVRNNFFDAKNRILGPSSLKDQLRYNQYGGNLGGWLPVPKLSTRENKRLFFFYNREETRRIVSQGNSLYYDVPSPAIMLNGNFSAWQLATNMTYAPQFKNGTIFQPGTITRDGAGNITGGNPFPSNTVPKSLWTPQSSALLNLFTSIPNYSSLPASPNPGYVRDYFVTPSTFTNHQNVLRLDYLIDSKTTAFWRWVDDDLATTQPNGTSSSEALPLMTQTNPKPGSAWLWNVVRIWTPAVATETIFSHNRLTSVISPVGDTSSLWNIASLGTGFKQLYPASNIENTIPNISAGAISDTWGSPGWRLDDKANTVTQNISWVKGAHSLKFGFYYFWDRKGNGVQAVGTTGAQGTLNFNPSSSMANDTGNGLANMMLGNFQSYTQPSALIYANTGFENREAFAEDSWKVNKRLTLEMGIRFQRNTQAHSFFSGGPMGTDGNWDNWNVDLAQYNPAKAPKIDLSTGLIIGNALAQLSQEGLIAEHGAGVQLGFAPPHNLWAPRLGFAYDLFGNGGTALRGGAGVFYDRLRQNSFAQASFGHWPNITSATALYGNVSNVDTSVTQGTPAVAPPGFAIFPLDGSVMPAIYQWNLGLQQSLVFGMVLDVAYVGSHATHLMDQRSVNALPAGTFIQYPNLSASVNFKNDALRPYVGWGSLTAVETASTSSYHALLVKLARRFSRGLSLSVNYSWSRTFADADSDTSQVNNPFDRHADWAPTSYDRTHVLVFNYVYELPHVKGALNNPFGRAVFNGWQLSGIFTLESGTPFTVSSNGSTMGIDAGSQRPNVIGDPYAGQSNTQWINPLAFSRPLDGQYGNLHRDALRMPGISNFDVSVSRTVAIKESMRVHFRADVFNIFNHPQIWGINTGFTGDNPGGTISASNKTLGTPTSYRDPRVFQFSAKFQF